MPQRLVLEGVHAGYGRVEVLRDLSISVPAGKVVALLGPNGAGKTTTMGVISGTVPVRRGRILLDGQPIHRLPADERARKGVTLIPEGRGIFPGLSVRENLSVAATASVDGAAERRAARRHVLELFPRLRERADQRAGTLSGGEQQMLALSRALLSSPRVLLMDEISMGLAPQIIASLFDTVEQLKAEGMTIVIVEQYLTYALRLADVCYVLSRGRVAFVGEPDELRGAELPGYVSA